MPTPSTPVKMSQMLAQARNAAFFLMGASMLLTGCAKPVASPLLGEKIYSPDAESPPYSVELPKPKTAPPKRDHQYTEDELMALNSLTEHDLLARPFRIDGEIYTQAGQEYVEGLYIKDNNGKVAVIFHARPVPEKYGPIAPRRICHKKPCGAVPIETAYLVSDEIREEWEKVQELEKQAKARQTTKNIKDASTKKIETIIETIESGEKALEELGLPVRTRLKSSSPQYSQ